MSKIFDLPIVKQLISFLRAVQPPGFNGFSLFDLLHMYVIGIIKGALTSRAGSISYSFFMALFPFLLFILNLLPFVPIENFDRIFLNFIEFSLPNETHGFFTDVFRDIQSKPRGGLLSSTFLLSILLSANGVSAIFSGFEVSYHIDLSRSFFKQYLFSIGVSLLLAALLLVGVIIFVYFEIYILKNLQSLVSSEINLIRTGQFLFFALLGYLAVSILYYFGTIEAKKARFFSPGALMTAMLFFLTTYLFGIYINNFSTYNQLYGSIGAMLIFMLYIWINSNILLLGFELNAILAKFKREPQNKKS